MKTVAGSILLLGALLCGGCNLARDAYEPDDRCDQAKPLTFGQPQIHNLTRYDHDWLSVQVVAGRRYRVRISRNFGAKDVVLQRFADCNPDGSGGNRFPHVDRMGTRSPQLVWQADRSGTAFLRVDIMGKATNRYEIVATEEPDR